MAFERDERRRRNIGVQRRGFRREHRRARRSARRVRRCRRAVGDLHRRRPHHARTRSTPASTTCPPVDAWSPTRSPRNRKPLLAQAYSTLRWRAAAIPALSWRAAGRLHRLAPADARHPVGGDQVTVYFIGAGPGAADLITVRGQRLLQSCPVCLYAGSIMPDDLLAHCPPGAKIVDTGPLTLEQIVNELADADAAGHDVARLHSGDPSLYSALAEQCRRLDALGIGYEIVPGVPAFAAAAAALKRELTVPGVAQTVTLTRVATLSTPMPPGEELANLAQSGATLVLHLAAAQIDNIVPAAARRRLPARNTRCGSGFRELATADRAARHAGRHRRADARRRHHQDRRHRRRRCAGRRRIHRQLPVFGRTSRRAGPLMRVLLLGGTAEGRELAARLHPHVDIISSLAGRVPDPALPVGPVRIGGFGGVDGLRRLAARRTHRRRRRRHPPVRGDHDRACRASVSRTRSAASGAGPPAWDPGGAIVVPSDTGAAETVAEQRYSRVFLTTGRSGVKAFADSDAWFLIRAVTEPDTDCCRVITSWCCPAGRIATTTNSRCWPSIASTRWSPRTAAAT